MNNPVYLIGLDTVYWESALLPSFIVTILTDILFFFILLAAVELSIGPFEY